MKRKFIIAVLILAPIFFGCSAPKEAEQKIAPIVEKKTPPNIILMIGDGMGLSQLSSAYAYGSQEPNFSRFKVIGLHKNKSGSHKITDSAAGATAFSAGKKTFNGAIGVDMDTNAVETIVEHVSKLGWNTGLVSTSTITHATPGSFYAHIYSRGEQSEIARQLTYSDVDFFAGGGGRYFYDRLDTVNYLDTLSKNGFKWDTAGLPTQIKDYNTKYGFLMDYDGLQPKHEGRQDELGTASMMCLDYLSKKEDPYFCMIEGSQIDWGGHANNGDYVIQETLDFDSILGRVLDFAEQQGNTIVIVTADHETGGFTMTGKKKQGAFKRLYSDYNTLDPKFSTDGHSYALVPVFAHGPESERFAGIYENTNIFNLMKDIANIGND